MLNPYYEFTIPVFVRSLMNMKALLVKAQAFAAEKGMAEEDLLGLRLAPDMFPFVKQVQIACDNAKGAAGRLAGVEIPRMEDNEATIDELCARIDKTVAYLNTFTPELFADASTKKIHLPWMPEGKHYEAPDYLRYFALANLYFHITTAYDILRSQGMKIGKTDYIGDITMVD